MTNLHGSLAPDALLSMKHIENTEWLPYSEPEGIWWGMGVPCQILPCTLPNTANTHMLDRNEQKPWSCCFYCFVSGTAVHFISTAFRSYKGRLTKDFKPIVDSRKKSGERTAVGGRRPETLWLSCLHCFESSSFPMFYFSWGEILSCNASTRWENIILTWTVH